jgi:8-hydroxy-5-deazaflavin:NADPH oxidoreductase
MRFVACPARGGSRSEGNLWLEVESARLDLLTPFARSLAGRATGPRFTRLAVRGLEDDVSPLEGAAQPAQGPRDPDSQRAGPVAGEPADLGVPQSVVEPQQQDRATARVELVQTLVQGLAHARIGGRAVSRRLALERSLQLLCVEEYRGAPAHGQSVEAPVPRDTEQVGAQVVDALPALDDLERLDEDDLGYIVAVGAVAEHPPAIVVDDGAVSIDDERQGRVRVAGCHGPRELVRVVTVADRPRPRTGLSTAADSGGGVLGRSPFVVAGCRRPARPARASRASWPDPRARATTPTLRSVELGLLHRGDSSLMRTLIHQRSCRRDADSDRLQSIALDFTCPLKSRLTVALDRHSRLRYETPMRIGVIGTGTMGRTLGGLFARHGHDVVIGSREGERGASVSRELGSGVRGGTIRDAAEHGEAVLLAVHFSAAEEALLAAGPLDGKVLLDCVNPLSPDFLALTVGHTTSAAEQIAAWAPKARVVKVFNHIFGQTLSEPVYGAVRATAFYCGDDPGAKEVAAGLTRELGFDPVDAGTLEVARYLEPLAELVIQLAYKQGLGPGFGLALLRR